MNFLQMRLGAVCALAALSLAPVCNADTRDKKTTISLSAPIAVPGRVLVPGTYIFKLLDSSSNRHIVQITNEDGNRTFSLAFTAAAQRLEPADRTVLTFYEGRADSPRALRAWYYPGDVDGQEFVYGKEQLRLLAVSNTTQAEPVQLSTRVESESSTTPPEPVKESAIVTLPASEVPPPIEAKEAQAQPAPEEPVLLAQAQEPPKTEPAPAAPPPSELPKTASDRPLIALGGFAAIALALGLRRWERSLSR